MCMGGELHDDVALRPLSVPAVVSKNPDENIPGVLFFPFKEAPNYQTARELAPGAQIIARTFGGYVAFTSVELYHYWMRNR